MPFEVAPPFALPAQYTGTPRTATGMVLGGTSGLLAAMTSVGAPPVILYLLAGPDPVRTPGRT